MDDYTAAADKLRREQQHLERVLEDDDPNIDLALAVAKRVRREGTVLVRALARHRDSYSPEGTSE
jgi:hypothetical protein